MSTFQQTAISSTILVLTLVAVIFLGCSEQDPGAPGPTAAQVERLNKVVPSGPVLATWQTYLGTAEVLDIYQDYDASEVVLIVKFTDSGGTAIRACRMDSHVDADWKGVELSISGSGIDTFHLEAFTSRAVGQKFKVKEYTSADHLELVVEEDATTGDIQEEYTLNGEVWSHKYDPSLGSLPFQAKEESFRAFYGDGGTLSNSNIDARRLNSLFGSDELLEFVVTFIAADLGAEPTVEQMDALRDTVEYQGTCILAGLCSGIKCWLGGPLNPACDSCAAVALACTIHEAGCFFEVWGDSVLDEIFC